MPEIRAVIAETRLVAWAMTYGVAVPSEMTSVLAYEISEPTSCESVSRTSSWTTCTSMDAASMPVFIPPAHEAAAEMWAATSDWSRRYASIASPDIELTSARRASSVWPACCRC